MTALTPFQCEKNARLLLDLARHWRAKSLGDINNFFAVDHDWQCPCCSRSKQEISRLHQDGRFKDGLLCSIAEHHDHFNTGRELQQKDIGYPLRLAYAARFIRFPPTFICQDCNNADPRVKRSVGAPENFSFAPHEIATFIIQRPHASHEINWSAAEAAWHSAKLSHDLMEGSLRGLVKQIRNEPEFERVFDAAKRIERDVRAKMDGENA
jgi:hypothetical protein